jgi:hypothetical protein
MNIKKAYEAFLNVLRRKNAKDDIEAGPVILAHTDGDDYDVLNKINRNIKQAAVAELPSTSGIDEAAAAGDLTPGNKYWILLALGFKAIGKNTWKHPLLDRSIEFDITVDELPDFSRWIYNRGYRQGTDNIQSEIKRTLGIR